MNKNISSVEYNLLNLPTGITYSDGRSATYIYDAGGKKLRTIYRVSAQATSVLTDYCGNMIYENNVLKQILFDGGYVTLNGSTPVYHFYLKDHLGNNRVVVSGNGTIEQVNHYYPYGGLMGESIGGDTQRYKYNGKELDRMHGLDWYDYGARHMDGARGQFTSIDKKAEKKFWQSPYVYGQDNPLRYIDPDGNDDWDKIMGYAIGIATDVIPLSGAARSLYSPTDARDYNSALQNTDNTMLAIGEGMANAGKGGSALGLATIAVGESIIVGSGGVAAIAGASTVAAGVTLTGVSAATGLAGSFLMMNASSNKGVGENRVTKNDASKNEKHGDGGRAQIKADKRINELKLKLQNATSRKEKQRIKQTIQNLHKIAEKKRHGEEHSNANKH